MNSARERHARLAGTIDAMGSAARRADRHEIGRALKQLAAADELDEGSLSFLHRAQDLVLNAAEAFKAVIDSHQGFVGVHDCQQGDQRDGASCTILQPTAVLTGPRRGRTAIDAAEAWRRVQQRLPDRQGESVLVHIQEFEDGFLAVPVQVAIPEPSPVPTIETSSAFVVDRTTGAVTRWPLLPLDVLARQYRRYQNGQPMTFDDP